MSNLVKQHLFWGLLLTVIVLVTLFSIEDCYVAEAEGLKGGALFIGVGKGAIFIGGTLTESGQDFTFEFYSGEYLFKTEKFCLWFKSIDEFLFIPFWIIALIPIVFWILAVRKIQLHRHA